jgi:hypothetical protein
MKKLSILLIGLLLVTGFAFADFGDVDISGSASVTWGVDLNTNATGFLNAGSSDVTLTLIDEGSGTTGGDDGLYGEITLEDWSMEIDTDETGTTTLSGTAGDVSAKIVVSPLEILIYTAPSMSWGNATVIETGDPDVAPALAAANTIGGVTLVLPVDPATIDVYVVSDGDWTSNAANDYAAGLDVEVEIAPITVALGGFYGWFNAAATFGGTAALDVALDALEGVDVGVGFDLVEGITWEVEFDATVNLTPENSDEDQTNVAVGVFYSEAADLDMSFGVTETTEGGFVDMLGATVMAEIHDLTSGTIAWLVDVTGEYDTGDLMPYFGFGYGSDDIFDLNVGVELYAGFTGIDNTTITLDYVSTDLSTDNGIITAEVEVSY